MITKEVGKTARSQWLQVELPVTLGGWPVCVCVLLGNLSECDD